MVTNNEKFQKDYKRRDVPFDCCEHCVHWDTLTRDIKRDWRKLAQWRLDQPGHPTPCSFIMNVEERLEAGESRSKLPPVIKCMTGNRRKNWQQYG